ncbi:hypothetical protein D8I30_08340 [Brevundimonas naejangsanensis]|uniref:Uncharacterized protein n=1 Tax=Brevundimonas naejangsanensis TaxID=588932 RepID=A0A494RFR0_9CAUL|nr:hypothetical protein [Brevundimonas naejangsanensis]AYG95188.1 hypothetical protein D8I30_08340 [Brevundimonas naejangsanensis]
MPRSLTIAVLLPALGAATAAWAQAGAAAPVRDGAAPRPPVIPHGGYPWRAGTPGFGRQLTPARSWGAPPSIPTPPPSADLLTPAPDLSPASSRAAVAFQPPAPSAPAPVEPAADPMAPRRDALIFQLQGRAPAPPASPPAEHETAAAAERPAPHPAPVEAAPQGAPAYGAGGARYYSVHRQAGRRPDATPIPAPAYLDALPVELDQPPASPDLAEPPAAPTLIRDAAGRLKAAPPADDPLTP